MYCWEWWCCRNTLCLFLHNCVRCALCTVMHRDWFPICVWCGRLRYFSVLERQYLFRVAGGMLSSTLTTQSLLHRTSAVSPISQLCGIRQFVVDQNSRAAGFVHCRSAFCNVVMLILQYNLTFDLLLQYFYCSSSSWGSVVSNPSLCCSSNPNEGTLLLCISVYAVSVDVLTHAVDLHKTASR